MDKFGAMMSQLIERVEDPRLSATLTTLEGEFRRLVGGGPLLETINAVRCRAECDCIELRAPAWSAGAPSAGKGRRLPCAHPSHFVDLDSHAAGTGVACLSSWPLTHPRGSDPSVVVRPSQDCDGLFWHGRQPATGPVFLLPSWAVCGFRSGLASR